jgi:hypothetical protein
MTEAKTFEYIKWHNHRRFDHEFGQDPDGTAARLSRQDYAHACQSTSS